MKLKLLILTLTSDKSILDNAHKLRGFFATTFTEHVLLHQHVCDKFVYNYPLVQYKKLDDKPTVIGINEGVDVLKEVYSKSDEIRLGNNKYTIFERQITVKEEEFGVSEQMNEYIFLSPWFALNQKNYKDYRDLSEKEQWEFLKKIIIGNIISMSKSLGYTVDKEIKVEFKLRKVSSSFKGIRIPAFKGKFRVNFNIPNYLGIGKSVSRGFGTVKKIN